MNWFLENAWLIPLLPLLGFTIITLTPIRASKRASGWLAIGLMIAATIVALGVAAAVATTGRAPVEAGEFAFAQPSIVREIRWAPAGGDDTLTMGYLIDPLAAAMLVMVTITSTCIHLFSLGYMAHDARQARFFSFISLFTAAMLLMVLASNMLLFFMAWEVMGLCSYLLIGFWYDKRYPDPRQITPRQAAIKAFITTRIGDVLFLIGLAYLWTQAGSLALGSDEGQIFNPAFLDRIAATPTALGMSAATAIALLLFAGTVGKSAQFPLHIWLPDAMEGPTPVSALIHAATMVAAGVFLVARTYPIFLASSALPIVALVGAFTALFAALIAVAQFDIKRILAYSTLSQLGFMVAALGIAGPAAAFFHLLTHAFFKALLFLGAGSIIHGMEATVGHDSNTAQDIRNMGGMRRFMPTTWITYMAGYLALAGIVPFAGFWSKDEILAHAFLHGDWGVYLALTAAAFLTAFYMTRQVLLVFYGEFRGHHPRTATRPSEPAAVEQPHPATPEQAVAGAHGHGGHVPHESPWTMTVPLIVLAIFATLGGLINLPFAGFHQLSDFLALEAGEFSLITAIVALVVALAGIGLATRVYSGAYASANDPDPLERAAPQVFRWLHGKFFVDEAYGATIGWLVQALAGAWSWFDRQVLDPLVNSTGMLTLFFGQINFIVDDTLLNDGADEASRAVMEGGDQTRRVETGRVQDYVLMVFAGVVVLGVIYLYVLQQFR